jgi:guanylate kinase
MSHWHEFDYVIINEHFQAAVEELRQVVAGRGEALRARRPAVEQLTGALLA